MARFREIPTLVVMVKAPIAGAVKTRLATSVGAVEAVRFYRSVTARLLRRLASDRRWRTVLAVSPDRHLGSRFWPIEVPRIGQGKGDLGTRMQHLLQASPGPVVLIGSDVPDIRPHHIADAFALVGRHGLVFGPSGDGGFWLVGTWGRPLVPPLFRNVRWSSEHALADTLSNLSGPVGLAATLTDVDTETDWRRWRGACLAWPAREGTKS